MFVYVRQATPLTSSPACSSRQVSTSDASALCGRFVMPTTVLVPRCLRAAAIVSREPPPAEIGDDQEPPLGRLRRSGRGMLGVGVAAEAAEVRGRVERGVARAAHPEEEHPPRLERQRLDAAVGDLRPGEARPASRRRRGSDSSGTELSHACSRSQRIPARGAYTHDGSNSAA